MAKDITIRVTGQNPDGTLNVQQVDGGNPFMTQPSTAMVPYNPSASAVAQPGPQGGYRAKINGVEVMFASEADYLKADRALREMVESQNVPVLGTLGGGRGGGTLGTLLRTGANAADAVAGYLQGCNLRRKMEELEDALAESRAAREELETFAADPGVGKLVPTLRRALQANRNVQETSLSMLEDQLTAIDIQTGSGVAKVAADLLKDGPLSTGEPSGGLGATLAVGGAGLGLGLLLSNSRDSERSRRRR